MAVASAGAVVPRSDTTERIFTAAGAMLASNGIDGFTIPNVAEAAGLARATVYNHFRSRDELVLRLLQRAMDEVAQPVDRPSSRHERVVAAALSMIAAFSQTIGSPAASMLALTAPDPELRQLQSSIAAEMTVRYRSALDLEVDALVADALVWATIGLLLRAGYGQVDIAELKTRILSVTEVVLAGLPEARGVPTDAY